MSVDLRPFEMSDLIDMEIQERHAYVKPKIWRNLLAVRPRMEGPWSFTGWQENGRPIGACGITPERMTWAVLAPRVGTEMVGITRAVRGVLEDHLAVTGKPPLAEIDQDFPQAARWANILGFKRYNGGNLWVFEP